MISPLKILPSSSNCSPDIVSEGRVDFDRLQAALGAAEALAPTGPEHYELRWAGKADARREVQRQTTATLLPDPARSVDFDTTENVFIEGENLEVLRVLQRGYFGKVKLIYIDPPLQHGLRFLRVPRRLRRAARRLRKGHRAA